MPWSELKRQLGGIYLTNNYILSTNKNVIFEEKYCFKLKSESNKNDNTKER